MTEKPLAIDPEKFDQLSNPIEDILSHVRDICEDNKNENEQRIALRTWIAAFLTNIEISSADTDESLSIFIAHNSKFLDEEYQKLVDKALK